VVVPKTTGNLKICVDFKKLNKVTKKNPHALPFFDGVLNTIAWHEAYSFLNGYLEYHQIFIAPTNRYETTFIID